MNNSANFVFAVIGFIIFCCLIAKYIMKPLLKQFPPLEKALQAFLAIGLVHDIIQFFT